LLSGEANSTADIQRMENHRDKKYIKEILRLRFLATDIVESIFNGKHPRDLTIKKLVNIKTLDWDEQRKLLNF
jgi:site-specific DNA recombinase